MTMHPDPDDCWQAVVRRDRARDGDFVFAVASTGIYCRPSCAARRPLRERVSFHADGAAARAAGYRPCRRCHPDDVARDRATVRAAAERIRAADAAGPAPSLTELAAQAGYSPAHFQRFFKRIMGISPAAYARSLRGERMRSALIEEGSVTDAIYAAGYGAASRFYADAPDRLGMTPSAWRAGGAGVTIRWTIAATSLGPLLIAATDRGLCRVAFDEDATALSARFPRADILQGGEALSTLAARVVAEVERPGSDADLPLDIRGTAFQEAVWQALRAVPSGQSLSYAALAARAGHPQATRATGSACGANPVAVVIPCHRVRRGDGSPGGYAWGLDRKAALLAREGRAED
ncbi:bifunctional DNA-binding transcriptional regulator/O6-methylguanine-DNA methyltransferase Ada [Sphingomonas sp. BGYR3]|uniref:bifunctional DNA-binding transcriptional regulator/O6-methylguanine-DNA methyltransferase Ada n=1 Tax=Sphingomonas sp. BGYR3 TaxID=2975483 RepID=UPI0021A7AAE5|nr:bifunctional DNA-binding transcriptional regulator/O6-methylguanine-DNA methyltransferase Ada [Sphingomonas sp. BGYR3]MDG5489524.1 bifunctional DNA-binding transcriptional regulator/O6-methylguanine-DNA methyltransferase Ada [Sphingomonas sp. BGYR3]